MSSENPFTNQPVENSSESTKDPINNPFAELQRKHKEAGGDKDFIEETFGPELVKEAVALRSQVAEFSKEYSRMTAQKTLAWDNIRNNFYRYLETQGIAGNDLKQYALYHVLEGSTPIPGIPLTAFDVPGDAIKKFITSRGDFLNTVEW